MKKLLPLFFFLLLTVLFTPASASDNQVALELAPPFVDNAILQREMPVPVWGWAKPKTTITVTFAGQKKTTQANAAGEWSLELAPLKANAEPQELTVTTSDKKTITLKNVLVGEVWFATGQSNMEWVAGKSKCRELASTLAKSEKELPIREYKVDTNSALFPSRRVTSADGWKSSRSASNFSALALSFAYDLQKELGVPVGILRSSHGATIIETWTPYEGFASHPKLKEIVTLIHQSDPTKEEGKAAYEKYYADLIQWEAENAEVVAKGGKASRRPTIPGIAAQWRGPTRQYNKKTEPLIPYAIRGVIWCQGTSNGNDGRIYAYKMEALLNGFREKWKNPNLPFYFTQQQCYGSAEYAPDKVGFADLREAQRLFFDKNRKNVGMVLQHDLNSANPGGIHYFNKLHPGQRLARWALANEYGKKIPYCGPLYKSHKIEGNKVRVQFEQPGPGGGLMVGSKGMASDKENYVEPAKPAPGKKLNHFRLAGEDRKWHPATAVITGENEVLVTSPKVPKPVGVQYAYCAVTMDANLYNKAGLPATAFCYFDGERVFQSETPEAIAAANAARLKEENPPAPSPHLHVNTLFRRGAVIQRDKPVPVWGWALPGTEVTATFGKQTQKTTATENGFWLLHLDAMPASTQERDLKVVCDNGPSKTIGKILVGDVWFMTGTRKLSSEIAYRPPRNIKANSPASPTPMPLLHEFRPNTKARTFREPRKKGFEIGGDFRYQAFWRPALFKDPDDDTSCAAYHFAKKVQEKDVPIGILTLGADCPPLSWVPMQALKTARGFEKERDHLFVNTPGTQPCKDALRQHIADVKKYNAQIAALLAAGKELPDELAVGPPPFPAPNMNVSTMPTVAYNFCFSPLTPYAVRGVVWLPGEKEISEDVKKYAPALEAFAASLPSVFGQKDVPFIYAQPTSKLVPGITKPKIRDAKSVEFDAWDKSLQGLAEKLGELAAE